MKRRPVNSRFGPIIYSCILPDSERLPELVSVTRQRCALPSNLLVIEHSNLSTSTSIFQFNFTVCVAPFVHGYNNVKQLIEMAEVAFLMGADNMVFYNYSASGVLKDIIEHYVDTGQADVVQWSIPVRGGDEGGLVKPDVHYYGQVPALNDCFYRNIYRSRYTVVMDMDEVIVPHKMDTWTPMMTSFPQKLLVIDYGAFIFRNAFFISPGRDEKPGRLPFDSELDIPDSADDISYLKTALREAYIYPAYERSKYIVDNHKAIALGIHYPFQYIESTTYDYIVPPKDGLLHHYRNDRRRNMSLPDSYYSRDHTLTDRSRALLGKIRHRYESYKGYRTMHKG